jgi:hypothetical protein
MQRRIINRLAGGLGNQIFQLGAVLLLAEQSGIKKIIFDNSALGSYKVKRKNELLNFFDFDELNLDVSFKYTKVASFRLPKIFQLNFSKFLFISDKNFQSIFNNSSKDFMIVDGYFQESLIQENFNKEIKQLKKILKYKVNDLKDDCIIHIRGGDFIKLGWNSVTPKEYYQSAVKTIQTKYKQDNFYVVTDDISYSKIILGELDIEYEIINSSIEEDFYLIGSCKYRILSSSTFALWASALGNNEDSIVIAPEYWTPNNERKIYIPNEIRVEF